MEPMRHTRSRSRLVTDSGAEPSRDADAAPAPSPSLAHTHTIPTIPVLKAISMEPAVATRSTTIRRPRHKMTEGQLERLEGLFQANTHPSREAKETLAMEIGMTPKSVLIWFQNRRQDRKRKTVSTSATGPASRTPVKPQSASGKTRARKLVAAKPSRATVPSAPATAEASSLANVSTSSTMSRATRVSPVHGSATTQPSRQPVNNDPPPMTSRSRPKPTVPVSASSRCSSSSDTLVRAGSYVPADHRHPKLDTTSPPSTCKHTASRPPPPTAPSPAPGHPTTAPPDFPKVQPFAATTNRDADHASSRAHRPDLEWACAHSAARRKHGLFVYRDEDDSAGESSEHEAELRDADADADGRPTKKHRRLGDRPRDVPQVAVPREYHALFAPDVVLGASLLLTFKHSV